MSKGKWCHVCDQSDEDHKLLDCDGETCIHCQGKWDECSCGVTKKDAN